MGFDTFLVLLAVPRLFRGIPAALVAMVLAAAAVRLLGLEKFGVQILGEVPAGLPSLRIPHFPLSMLPSLLGDAAGPSLRWLVLDMLPISMIDATGLYTVEELANVLHEQDVVLAAAGRKTGWRLWAESRHRGQHDRKIAIYSTIEEAVTAFQRERVGASGAPQGEGLFRSPGV